MSNSNKRNEIIRVFRKFARMGLADRAYNPIQTYKRIDMLCASRRLKLDMLAVFDTLRLLELNGEEDVLAAVLEIYFSNLSHRLTKKETGRLISKCAEKSFCDERTVYRRLEKARKLYEKLRACEGLINDNV